MPTTKTKTSPPQDNAGVVAPEKPKRLATFIVRQSHLGFRAYKVTIEGDSLGEPVPLHNAPDLETVAISLATQFLEGSLR